MTQEVATEPKKLDEQKIRDIVHDIWKEFVADLSDEDYAALRREVRPTPEEEKQTHRIIGIVSDIWDASLDWTGCNEDEDEEVLKRLGKLLGKPQRPTIAELNE